MRRSWWVSTVFVAFLAVAVFAARPQGLQSEPVATFVGSEKCKECHEPEYKEFAAGAHGQAAGDSVLIGQSVNCETCHGPGSRHVAADGDTEKPGFWDVRNFKKMTVAEINGTCRTCHKAGEQLHWDNSMHAREDLACTSCHSMHHPQDVSKQAMLNNSNTNELCLSCHRNKRLGVTRSSHMPLAEGGMNCADCHNPHGSSSDHMIRFASTNELCESCHTDKRGPFLWEHAPVRENCLNCHEPHGSNNDKLLAGKKPYLCQRCHIGTRHPSTLYDNPDLASNRLFNRSCTNCHSQIHGSNHPSGQFFLR